VIKMAQESGEKNPQSPLKGEGQQKKKYKSFFDLYDKIAFRSGEKDLSKNIDKILYGKRNKR
jgi:hypothetical protein